LSFHTTSGVHELLWTGDRRSTDWNAIFAAIAILAIFPRRIGGESSGWFVYLNRRRENGKWGLPLRLISFVFWIT
jgi:hypothetical protein